MTAGERMVIRQALDIARRKEAQIEELKAANDALSRELGILRRKRMRVTVRAERMRRKILRLEERNDRLRRTSEKWRTRANTRARSLKNAQLRIQRVRYAAKRAA